MTLVVLLDADTTEDVRLRKSEDATRRKLDEMLGSDTVRRSTTLCNLMAALDSQTVKLLALLLFLRVGIEARGLVNSSSELKGNAVTFAMPSTSLPPQESARSDDLVLAGAGSAHGILDTHCSS